MFCTFEEIGWDNPFPRTGCNPNCSPQDNQRRAKTQPAEIQKKRPNDRSLYIYTAIAIVIVIVIVIAFVIAFALSIPIRDDRPR